MTAGAKGLKARANKFTDSDFKEMWGWRLRELILEDLWATRWEALEEIKALVKAHGLERRGWLQDPNNCCAVLWDKINALIEPAGEKCMYEDIICSSCKTNLPIECHCKCHKPTPEPGKCEHDKAFADALFKGVGMMMDGKRINPEDTYKPPLPGEVEEMPDKLELLCADMAGHLENHEYGWFEAKLKKLVRELMRGRS